MHTQLQDITESTWKATKVDIITLMSEHPVMITPPELKPSLPCPLQTRHQGSVLTTGCPTPASATI